MKNENLFEWNRKKEEKEGNKLALFVNFCLWVILCSVWSFGCKLFVQELLDAVVHCVDQVELGLADAYLVGYVENALVRVGSVLAVNAARLQVERLAQLRQPVGRRLQLGQLDVDGGAQAGADVRRTEGQVAEALVFDELELLLEQEEAFDESSVHLPHARSLLYRNDANVILLVEPNEKCLVSVDEHATIYRPIHLQQHKFIFHFENKKHLVN